MINLNCLTAGALEGRPAAPVPGQQPAGPVQDQEQGGQDPLGLRARPQQRQARPGDEVRGGPSLRHPRSSSTLGAAPCATPGHVHLEGIEVRRDSHPLRGKGRQGRRTDGKGQNPLETRFGLPQVRSLNVLSHFKKLQ